MLVSGTRLCGRIQRCSVSDEMAYGAALGRQSEGDEMQKIARLAFINGFDVGNGSQNGAESQREAIHY